MRTRLDEIVEEEIRAEAGDRHAGPMVAAICKRIAERAFRHGTERTHEAFTGCTIGIWGPYDKLLVRGEEVRPAPAEEKWTPGDCPLCGHIAHGGECAHGRAMHHGSTCKCASLYPAPAEEKVPVRCPTCGGLPHPYPPSLDRRKAGERRRVRLMEALSPRPHTRRCDRRKP